MRNAGTHGENMVKVNDYIKNNTLKILVKANSSKTEIKGYDANRKALRVNVKALPEKGKANAEIVKFFSKMLKKRIKISSGLSSREKTLRV